MLLREQSEFLTFAEQREREREYNRREKKMVLNIERTTCSMKKRGACFHIAISISHMFKV